MAVFENTIEFNVSPGENYSLTILIGEAQKGFTSLKTLDGKYHFGDIYNLSLGNGTEMKGQWIGIASMITDINPNTDRTSIKYLINDQEVQTFTEDVPQGEVSNTYTTRLNFN